MANGGRSSRRAEGNLARVAHPELSKLFFQAPVRVLTSSLDEWELGALGILWTVGEKGKEWA